MQSASTDAQLVALWALSSWNCAMSRVDAQMEVMVAWHALVELSLYHGLVKRRERLKDLLPDVTVSSYEPIAPWTGVLDLPLLTALIALAVTSCCVFLVGDNPFDASSGLQRRRNVTSACDTAAIPVHAHSL